MVFEIDFNSDEAIYIQLHNQIIMGIATEEYTQGQSLPSVRQMAEVLGVNMHTVNKTYGILRDEGFLKVDRRSGAVVWVESDSKAKELEEMKERLYPIVTKCICKGISKEEICQLIDGIYSEIG
ncbi:MAG: GntR family transcriptional regulator [Anaerostipes sp.]|jgi:GntR family transcriptional regulator|nr:GntR family transcriptional regulator [Anaerostipes sp.]MDD3745159.1 GntR family transcriptional regulator [Anaerostipes sp.]